MKKEFKGCANKGGIYRIINTKNGKIYIGSAKRFRERAQGHNSSLRNNRHQNKHLQASWNKHGGNAFVFEVLEVIKGDKLVRTTREEELLQEQINLGNWDRCYNISKVCRTYQPKLPTIIPWNKGKRGLLKHSPEIRALISDASKAMWTQEHRKRFKASFARIGKKLSKTYFFVDPKGIKQEITNLKLFCRKHPELNDRLLNAVWLEKRRSHKGWTKFDCKTDWSKKAEARIQKQKIAKSTSEAREFYRNITKSLWQNKEYRKNQEKSRLLRCLPIFQLDSKGNIVKRWSSTKEAAEHFGVTKACIKQGIWNNKAAAGFFWKYA